ncbi:hypothetical protein [Cutibacterium avidum]|uniref:hypothetical protein n=1 Tax=Cutibacterium avidum TaxID=33010 RepID=UPI001E63F2A0|nr:hypothetical protein [Cutibacterium avidum]
MEGQQAVRETHQGGPCQLIDAQRAAGRWHGRPGSCARALLQVATPGGPSVVDRECVPTSGASRSGGAARSPIDVASPVVERYWWVLHLGCRPGQHGRRQVFSTSCARVQPAPSAPVHRDNGLVIH